MGQEVAATSLQLIRACAAVANGGLLVKPKLMTEIDGTPTPTEQPKRVLRADTAATMRAMMEGVVSEWHRAHHQVERLERRRQNRNRADLRKRSLHASLQRLIHGIRSGE